uniref:Arylsulfatase A-like n=1 Tax=Saccoglossus kowalevskii TaxID=10224 RepID=A0ABM0MQ74_SACKO|nr:PREDICTED: arylsulfatase A-like [Saccoglossus kowalevskii]
MAAPLVDLGLVSKILFICLITFNASSAEETVHKKPNIVIIFADDLGYGDLPSYGHPTSYSPNIDQLVANGLVFTQFYSANSVCSPSRASLLTARLPPRTGIWPGVFSASSTGGLPLNETTIAAVLKPLGYSTAIIGKWHLGVGQNQKYLPTNYGFDSYVGVPYSHDMCPCLKCFYPSDPCFDQCRMYDASCPLFHNNTIVQQPVDLTTLTEVYSTEAKNFISGNAKSGTPFFLYLPFQHTHHPQFAGKYFRNSTLRGTFGDSLAELDWAVGQIIQELRLQKVEDNTFVFFTSDNGPSLTREVRGGNAGLLKCGKGTTYEGGQRVPGIAYWPGMIKPGRSMELASTLDLLPTIVKLTNGTLPRVAIDGVDIGSVLFKSEKSPRKTFFYYFSEAFPQYGVYAVRYKQYKAHYYTQGSGLSGEENPDLDCRPTAKRTLHNPPLLYDLHHDPSEIYNLNSDPQYSTILTIITDIKKRFESTVVWSESEVQKKK